MKSVKLRIFAEISPLSVNLQRDAKSCWMWNRYLFVKVCYYSPPQVAVRAVI